MKTLQQLKAQMLESSAVRAEYEALAPEYETAAQVAGAFADLALYGQNAEQIEGWASPVGAGALVAMLDDARKALALVDEIGAKLPRECQEQRACAAAAGAIGALIVLLGAAKEDVA